MGRHPFRCLGFRGNDAQFCHSLKLSHDFLLHCNGHFPGCTYIGRTGLIYIACDKQTGSLPSAVVSNKSLNSCTSGSWFATACTCGPNCIRPIAMVSCNPSSGLTLRSTTWNLSWPCSQSNIVVPSVLIVCPPYAMRLTFFISVYVSCGYNEV